MIARDFSARENPQKIFPVFSRAAGNGRDSATPVSAPLGAAAATGSAAMA